MSIGQLPLPDAACRAIVRQAVEWVIVRLNALPEEAQHVSQWPEYAGLLEMEHLVEEACFAGAQRDTARLAQAYCVGWLAAIKVRRKATGEKE